MPNITKSSYFHSARCRNEILNINIRSNNERSADKLKDYNLDTCNINEKVLVDDYRIKYLELVQNMQK
jgi:hypothetical protein